MAKYDAKDVKQNLDKLANQLLLLFKEYKIITLEENEENEQENVIKKSLEDIVQKTLKYSQELYESNMVLEGDQYAHFLQAAELYKQILKMEEELLESKINKIDSSKPGIASRMSNATYDAYSSFKRALGFESSDANILTRIMKTVFKPIGYIVSLFEAATPDKWRMANTKQKFYITTGVGLTIAGIAFIVTAIVLGVTSPLGVITGIGVTVAWGALALGLAATICVGIGGVLLDETKNAINKNIVKKNIFKDLNKKCTAAKNNLDSAIEKAKKANLSPEYTKEEEKPNLTFSKIDMEYQLDEVRGKITKLQQSQHNDRTSFRI